MKASMYAAKYLPTYTSDCLADVLSFQFLKM